MDYGLSDAQRAVALAKLETFLGDDSLHSISLKRVSGRGRGRKELAVPGADYSRDLLSALGSPDAVLDELVGAHGGLGGSFVARAVFVGEDGAPDWEHQLSVGFSLVRRPAGAGKGSASAVEGIASTLSDSMAAHTRQLGSLYDRLDTVSSSLIDRTLQGGEQRLADVMALQGEISRLNIELMEARLRATMAEEHQTGLLESLPPEVLVDLAKGIGPLIGQIGGLGIRYLTARTELAELDAGIGPAADDASDDDAAGPPA